MAIFEPEDSQNANIFPMNKLKFNIFALNSSVFGKVRSWLEINGWKW